MVNFNCFLKFRKVKYIIFKDFNTFGRGSQFVLKRHCLFVYSIAYCARTCFNKFSKAPPCYVDK